MARTVRDARLETRTARAALKPSGKPYFRAIDEGLHLGYRKGKTAGKWVVRRYLDGAYEVETIGAADDTIDADGGAILSFQQAQALARDKFVERKRAAAGLPTKAAGPYTVSDAINDYIGWLEQNRKTARDARWRAESLILPSLGSLPCAKLTTHRIREWLQALAKQPPRLRTKKGEVQRYLKANTDDPAEATRRRKATANRTLTILKASLNYAWREHKIASDDDNVRQDGVISRCIWRVDRQAGAGGEDCRA